MATADSKQDQTAVHSLTAKRKERDVIEELRAHGKEYNIKEIIPIQSRDICVAEWVRLKCKYGCRKYGTSWCCAPETPDPDQARAVLAEYERALLLCSSKTNEQFYRDSQKKRRKQVNTWKGTLALERRLFLRGYYKAFALVPDSCALCKECAYPDPCKFPANKRPSVESFSIDVFETIKNVGKKHEIANHIDDEYDCYSIILMR